MSKNSRNLSLIVRIPVVWSGTFENQAACKIKDSRPAIMEVIWYLISNGMYAIIAIHRDGGWMEEHPTYVDQKNVTVNCETKFRHILADFDRHLIVAGANEIHWGYGNPTAEHIAVHQSYMQTFADTVREERRSEFADSGLSGGYPVNCQQSETPA
jgi:endoglucanase